MSTTTLGIDIGATAVHVAILDAHGEVVARSSSALPDVSEIETDHWIEALRDALLPVRAALREGAVTVGISGQVGAYTFLDEDDVEIAATPLAHDRRTEWVARELRQAYGHPVEISHLAARVLWRKTYRGDEFATAHRVLTTRALLYYRLTGERSEDAGDAAATGLHAGAGGWKKAALDVIDPRVFALVAGHDATDHPASPAPILPDAAAFLGIPPSARVHVGSSDCLQAARALGLTAPGPVMLRIGHGGCALSAHPDAVEDSDRWCSSLPGETAASLIRVSLPDVLASVHDAAEDLLRAGGPSWPATLPPRQPGLDADPLGLAELSVSDAARVPLTFPTIAQIDRPALVRKRRSAARERPLPGPRETQQDSPDDRDSQGVGRTSDEPSPDKWYRMTLVGAALHCVWALDQLRAMGVGVAGIELIVEEHTGAFPREFPPVLATAAGLPVRVHRTAHLPAIGAALQAAGLSASPPVGDWIQPTSNLTRKYAPLLERFAIEVRRTYRLRNGRSRQDPPRGYVQHLLSTEW